MCHTRLGDGRGGGGGCAIRGWGMVGVEEEGVPYEAGGW